MGAGLALTLYAAPAMAWGGDGGHGSNAHGAKVTAAAHGNSSRGSDKDAHGDAASAAAHTRTPAPKTVDRDDTRGD
ncbi:MAG TPA: hypothetical protein VFS62_03390, partial [Chloroflexota bacterium]|nr:hypothetical protein [Chloroflexota bacterium]